MKAQRKIGSTADFGTPLYLDPAKFIKMQKRVNKTMAILSGKSFGVEICEALGLDAKKVNRLDIHIPANALVTIIARIHPDKIEGDKVVHIIKKYRLHEIEEK